jgi:hypothetical protein
LNSPNFPAAKDEENVRLELKLSATDGSFVPVVPVSHETPKDSAVSADMIVELLAGEKKKVQSAEVERNHPCHIHTHCFRALQQRIERLESEESNVDDPSHALMYAHQLLDAYKPRGRSALLAPLLHFSITLAAVAPFVGFFFFLSVTQVQYYALNWFWSLGVYSLTLVLIHVVVAIVYFMLVYLEFPFMVPNPLPPPELLFLHLSPKL